MKLVIAEKPSVAKEIAKVLGADKKEKSYYKNDKYIVSWCYGHLISLAQPQDYDQKYKKWSLEDLPIIPKKYKFIVNTSTKDQFYILKKLMNSLDTTEIICATDSGREGELIFRLVYEKANCKKPFKRLWISSLTEESIQKGFENLHDGDKYNNLFQAGLKRAMSDWLIGMNASRFYSIIYRNKVTIGRVQTPTLSIVVEREKDILSFKKEKNYKLFLQKDEFIAESKVFSKESEVTQIFEKINKKQAICTKAENKTVQRIPPKLYDLTLLQRDCNKFLNLSAQETMNIAQSLYEKKLISYPRTDSNYISSDMKNETIYIIKKIYKEFNIGDVICNINQVVNNKKVTDHHAIIPTKNIYHSSLENLNYNEKQVLKMIYKRLLESVHKKSISLEYLYEITVEDTIFTSKNEVKVDLGYLELTNLFLKWILGKNFKNEDKVIKLTLKKGDILENYDMSIHEYFTQPPKRYTEATLLSAMENSCNKDYKELDGDYEKKGLGTPATRAAIIERLINVGYITRKGKALIPTEKGIYTIDIVNEKIKSPSMTTEWEVKLQKVEKGQYNSDVFFQEIANFIKEFLHNSKLDKNIKKELTSPNGEDKTKEREVIGECLRCKSNVYEGLKNFYCSNIDCNFSLFKEDKFFTSKKVKLTKERVKALLKKGEIHFKKLYSEKKNTNYSATIYIELTEKYVNYKLKF